MIAYIAPIIIYSFGYLAGQSSTGLRGWVGAVITYTVVFVVLKIFKWFFVKI